eukprot:jgi/Botrbrau1/11220/Bobra.0075s0016.1
MWPPSAGSSKDYIAEPKPSGYQSLHLTVAMDPPAVPEESLDQGPGPNCQGPSPTCAGPTVELQFRTQSMHEAASQRARRSAQRSTRGVPWGSQGRPQEMEEVHATGGLPTGSVG